MRAKYIYEKFTSEGDPIHDMGIGLKQMVNKWTEYVNTTYSIGGFKTENRIGSIKFNKDGTLDVGKPISEKDVEYIIKSEHASLPEPLIIRGDAIKELPEYINFNKCYGSCFLNCSSITSLHGCPRIVYGHFCINNNADLNSLKYFPEIIYGTAYIDSKFEINKSHIEKNCIIKGNLHWWHY